MSTAASGAAVEAETVEAPSGKGRGDENFPVGSWLIRRDLRVHVHAFYRFARNADDIADSPDLSADEKIRRFDRMAAILDGDPGGAPGSDSPAAAAMRASLAVTGVDGGALPRRAARVPPGRGEAALPRLGRSDGILPLFGRAGRPAAARSARRGPAYLAGIGRAVRRAASPQPSAGLRRRLPRPRPRLYTAERSDG